MKKNLLLCLSVALLVLLTACGIELNTNLSVSHDFKGKRVIECTIDKHDLSNLNKDFAFLDSTIKENCPDSMSYKNLSKDNFINYQFTISFSSLQDYKEKVTACLNFAPNITYDYGTTPFADGLLYNENFTSQDLMAWFSESLIKEGLMSDSEAQQIWSIKDTAFYFDNKKQIVEEPIDVNTITYLALDQIRVYTEEQDSGGYRQKIVFQIPEETLNRRGNDIRDYLTDHLDSSSYSCEWIGIEHGKECQITFQSDTMKQLNQMTSKVLKEDCSFRLNSSADNKTPCKINHKFVQKLSFSAFRSSAKGMVNYKVYFKPASGTILNSSSKADADGFYEISSGTKTSVSLQFETTKQLSVYSYQMTTIYHDEQKFQRELSLTFEHSLTKSEQELFLSYFKQYHFQTVSFESDKQLLLILKDTPTQISSVFQKIFGNENKITSKISKHSLSHSQKTEITDSIDLSNLSFSSNAEGTYYFISNNKESAKEASVKINGKHCELEKLKALVKTSVFRSSDLSNFKVEYKTKMTPGTMTEFHYRGGITDVYGSMAIIVTFFIIITAIVILFLYRHKKQIYHYIQHYREKKQQK